MVFLLSLVYIFLIKHNALYNYITQFANFIVLKAGPDYEMDSTTFLSSRI